MVKLATTPRLLGININVYLLHLAQCFVLSLTCARQEVQNYASFVLNCLLIIIN